MHLSMWGVIPVLKRLKNKAQSQLGSSGGGNHFADLCIGTWLDTDKKFVALMTHSGSRGTGHQIATHYSKLADEYASKKLRGLKKGHGWLDMDSDLGREYFIAMSMMGMYAAANHELIHADFAKTAGVTAQEVVSNRHNYAWYAPGAGEMVHRKGATPAHAGEFGIIPGSSGSASYIVQGLGNPDSVYSSSHGAGRPFSRTQAKLQHNAVNFETHMTERGVLYAGIAPDETFMAYKDIEEVMAVQDGVLLKRVARLEPKIVLMGGKSDDGD
jgi:tRNA-splicing ligase RtcB